MKQVGRREFLLDSIDIEEELAMAMDPGSMDPRSPYKYHSTPKTSIPEPRTLERESSLLTTCWSESN